MTPSHAALARAALLGALMLLLVGAPVAAHADLEGSDPADGDTLVGGPAEVSGAFTEPLDPAASRLVLVNEVGERLAEGGVDTANGLGTTMRLEPPALAPGVYEVRWTARTPDDGFVARGRWSFTVTAATETPSPLPSPTPGASQPPLSAEPSAPPASVTPTAAASASPPAASPTAAPAMSPAPGDDGDNGSDGLGGVAIPLLALGAVAAAAVLYLARRPR